MSNFIKVRLVEAELFHADGQTDSRTRWMSVTFRAWKQDGLILASGFSGFLHSVALYIVSNFTRETHGIFRVPVCHYCQKGFNYQPGWGDVIIQTVPAVTTPQFHNMDQISFQCMYYQCTGTFKGNHTHEIPCSDTDLDTCHYPGLQPLREANNTGFVAQPSALGNTTPGFLPGKY